MKANVLDLDGNVAKNIELPIQFEEEYRPDIIRRAFMAVRTSKRQAYGSKEGAGMRQSAKLSRRRRDFRGAYGKGISRVPRKTLTRRGTQFYWIGANAPNTVGGMRSHPPKAEKIWLEEINIKERRKAIRSALAATMKKEIVMQRGHKIKTIFPFIIDSKIENMTKTKEVANFLGKIGLDEELKRTKEVKIRSGVGKKRGRKYKEKKGILFILSKNNCGLAKSARNIEGCDVAVVNNVNAEILAPGGNASRLCIWSEAAIEKLAKDRLFL